MSRFAAVLLLGLWLGLLFSSWVMATVNFRTVDRVLGPALRPEVAQKLAGVAPEERRAVLRHLVSEINRWMFRCWGFAQLVLGAVTVALLWPAGGGARLLAGAALAVLAFQALALSGSIVEAGRALDFAARPLPPDVARRFGLLHGAYVLSDLVKAALLAVTAALLLKR